ncbi:MAG: hypothetical protein M3041_13810 [Acidobacteriota bacterium]|nr:hypothetical protein [Acidobacteriota bacterium]
MSLLLALLFLLQDDTPPANPPANVISGPLTMAASTEKRDSNGDRPLM